MISEEAATAAIQGAVAMAARGRGLMEKAGKDGPPKSSGAEGSHQDPESSRT